MLKVLGVIVGLLAVVVIGVIVFASTRPDTFRVERSITIAAPPEKIVGFIEDFHRWRAWSPYEKLDPQMARTYGGSQKGVGATYGWSGKKSGEGRMEIVEVAPTSKVAIKLDFTKPMQTHNIATFTLAPKGSATQVTWAMDGPSPLVAKVMGLFFDMDTMVGKDFETGLYNLKAAAES